MQLMAEKVPLILLCFICPSDYFACGGVFYLPIGGSILRKAHWKIDLWLTYANTVRL